MSLRDQLQAIYDDRGILTPEVVVEEARPKNHPLHSQFEWNNTVAGAAYRRIQAHELIQKARVVYREASGTIPAGDIRAFHAVRTERGHEYLPAEKIAADPLTREMVLRDMEREWKQLRARYEGFREFLEMVKHDIAA